MKGKMMMSEKEMQSMMNKVMGKGMMDDKSMGKKKKKGMK